MTNQCSSEDIRKVKAILEAVVELNQGENRDRLIETIKRCASKTGLSAQVLTSSLGKISGITPEEIAAIVRAATTPASGSGAQAEAQVVDNNINKGDHVGIYNLIRRSDLNGKSATVINILENNRYSVKVDGPNSNEVSVSFNNLLKINDKVEIIGGEHKNSKGTILNIGETENSALVSLENGESRSINIINLEKISTLGGGKRKSKKNKSKNNKSKKSKSKKRRSKRRKHRKMRRTRR